MKSISFNLWVRLIAGSVIGAIIYFFSSTRKQVNKL